MRFGMDYLGGAKYGGLILRNHPRGLAAGFFAETFGNCWPVVEKLAAKGGAFCPMIRIQGPWTNHAYDPKRHDAAIFSALKKVNSLAARYPGIEWQFSPVCESDAKGKAWEDLIKRCAGQAVGVRIIVSIGTKGAAVRGFRTEVHGSTPAPRGEYQYSHDGTNSVDANTENDKVKHKRGEWFFFWHPAFNLKYKTKLSGDETKEVRENDSAPP